MSTEIPKILLYTAGYFPHHSLRLERRRRRRRIRTREKKEQYV